MIETTCPKCGTRETTIVCHVCKTSKTPPTPIQIEFYKFALAHGSNEEIACLESLHPSLILMRPKLREQALAERGLA